MKKIICIIISTFFILNIVTTNIDTNIEKVSADSVFKADVNCDGIISIEDALCMKRYLLGQYELSDTSRIASDIDSNGEVDILDMVLLIKKILDDKENDDAFKLPDSPYNDIKRDAAELINKKRIENGLPMLKFDEKLSYIANVRAEELSVVYQNTRPNGDTCKSLLNEYGVGVSYLCQYIMKSNKTSSSIANSVTNKQTYLNDYYNKIGIGCYDNGTLYWVVFITS